MISDFPTGPNFVFVCTSIIIPNRKFQLKDLLTVKCKATYHSYPGSNPKREIGADLILEILKYFLILFCS